MLERAEKASRGKIWAYHRRVEILWCQIWMDIESIAKKTKSVFLYSQNGTTYSNWESDELIALVAMALLAKELNEGEVLSKTYTNNEERQQRYKKREIDLFQKTIYLRKQPRKLFMLGSPIGTYQIYY